jgi:lipopolysaccharide transport system ATP-binding protein
MSDTVIRVENLGKRYTLRHQAETRYVALRDVIATRAKSLVRRLASHTPHPTPHTREEFWALKDVSFEVKQGDRVGIIGRNGAGKSTLLKILSRITEPTRGRIALRGRVASLLEVGTGFHPELTGRENIYLNGAVLGMTKAEIRRKFDEIVAFAEVEKFLDTPVKHYSSGMYVRLAFAVAAHLEPEILVVDEVLAVGDAEFQKKCLGKMEDVAVNEGRTVLFVSHNMGTITQLCTKAIYLNQGHILNYGDVNSVISQYLTTGISNDASKVLGDNKEDISSAKVVFKEISIIGCDNKPSTQIDVRYPFFINLVYKVTKPVRNVEISVRIDSDDGRPVFTSHQSESTPECLDCRDPGIYNVLIKIPEMLLMPGSYLVTIGAHEPMIQFHDVYEHIIGFCINETGTKLSKYQQNRQNGVILVNLPWLMK